LSWICALGLGAALLALLHHSLFLPLGRVSAFCSALLLPSLDLGHIDHDDDDGDDYHDDEDEDGDDDTTCYSS
jgi:hypothetical protein